MKKRDSEDFPFNYLADTRNSPAGETFDGMDAKSTDHMDVLRAPVSSRAAYNRSDMPLRTPSQDAYPYRSAYVNENSQQEGISSYPTRPSYGPPRRTLNYQIQILSLISATLLMIVLILAFFAFSGNSASNETNNKPSVSSQPSVSAATTLAPTVSTTPAATETTAVNDPNSLANMPPSAEHPVIALTFDDGPAGDYTTKLLGILEAENVHATFFLLGNCVLDSDPAILQQMVTDGDEIGNHSYDHSLYTSLSKDEIRQQLQKTNDAIFAAAGVYPTVMRPPSGNCNDDVLALSTEMNLPVINWSWQTCPEDWIAKNQTIEYISGHVIENASNGQIVLLHDIHEVTVNSVETMIDGLKAKGYRFVTVSELLAAQPDGEKTGVLYYNGSYS